MCWLSECECNVMLCDAPVMRVREPELPAPAREPARRPRLAPAPALAATDCERRPAEQHPQQAENTREVGSCNVDLIHSFVLKTGIFQNQSYSST